MSPLVCFKVLKLLANVLVKFLEMTWTYKFYILFPGRGTVLAHWSYHNCGTNKVN